LILSELPGQTKGKIYLSCKQKLAKALYRVSSNQLLFKIVMAKEMIKYKARTASPLRSWPSHDGNLLLFIKGKDKGWEVCGGPENQGPRITLAPL
jgi:hypothetical protein